MPLSNTVFFYRPQRSWGKLIFLQASVILLTGGAWSRGVPGPGACLLRGGVCSGGVWVSAPEGGLFPRGVPGPRGVSGPGGCLLPGGAWWRPCQDGHCCGRYASYWNAFLFIIYILEMTTIQTYTLMVYHLYGCPVNKLNYLETHSEIFYQTGQHSSRMHTSRLETVRAFSNFHKNYVIPLKMQEIPDVPTKYVRKFWD